MEINEQPAGVGASFHFGIPPYLDSAQVRTSMDESQSLDALSNVLSQLETKPFDLSLHATHIRLTQSLEGMQDDALSAMELLISFFAAGEDVWLALIKAKEDTVDLNSANGVEELLALYKRAEEDYLCAA